MPGEDIAHATDAEARVRCHFIPACIEARLGPIPVLEISHLVPELLKADQILQVMPGKSAERLTEEKLDRILSDLRSSGSSALKSGPFMWPEPLAAKAETPGR